MINHSDSTTEMESQEYIGFWIRFIAFLIDSVIAAIVISPLVALFFGKVDMINFDLSKTEETIAFLSAYSVNTSIQSLLIGIAFILFWIYKSSDPGKMVFKAVIVNAKNGGKPAASAMVIRYLGYFVNMFAFGLGFLWIAFDPRKQGWHDKMAGTVVIRKSN